MTSLEKFLNKDTVKTVKVMEPASGSFTCQNIDCNEIEHEGFIDRENNRLVWTCFNGHNSSVAI